VDRYVRCATCTKIVIARAEACPFCQTALAPETPILTPPLTVPRRDIDGGACLLRGARTRLLLILPAN